MAYVNPNILQQEWDNLTGWVSRDTNGGVSSISPAGQFYGDITNPTGNAQAGRQDDDIITSTGSADVWVEIRSKGDVWDGFSESVGFRLIISCGTNEMVINWGNGAAIGGDGVWIDDGAGDQKVLVKTWNNNWHTIVIHIHNSQTDADVWIDKDPNTEGADIVDADITTGVSREGLARLDVRGDTNGEYHIDYLYVGTELASVNFVMSVTVGVFTLTGISVALRAGVKMVVSVGNFILTGISVIFSRTGWDNQSKNTTSWTEQNKNTTNYTNKSKNTTNWTNQNKN